MDLSEVLPELSGSAGPQQGRSRAIARHRPLDHRRRAREAGVGARPHGGVARGRHPAVRDAAGPRCRLDRAQTRPTRRPVSGEYRRGRDRSMTRFRVTPFCVTLVSWTMVLSCGGDRSRSPTCGMAQLIGPSLIQDRLRLLPFVLTDAPRGLPGTLPIRVVATPPQSTVAVTYSKGALTREYQGAGFPATSVSDSTAYAILV